MRLTCPNCGAQYEVPDEVIPTSGRDVQCSNCGDTWFQHHPDHPAESEQDDAQDVIWEAPEDEADENAAPEDSAEEEQEEEASPEPPTRKELDPSVADVLREEAERETAARAAESGSGLETQPELGLSDTLDDMDRRTAEARARMARLRGEADDTTAPDQDEDDGPDPGTRRNLLPDIDEINSSLDSDSADPGLVQPGDAEEAANESKPGGFRRGFRTAVLLALLGLILYMFAPQIAQTIPALDGVLAGYVELVNGLRNWLDQTVAGVTNG